MASFVIHVTEVKYDGWTEGCRLMGGKKKKGKIWSGILRHTETIIQQTGDLKGQKSFPGFPLIVSQYSFYTKLLSF